MTVAETAAGRGARAASDLIPLLAEVAEAAAALRASAVEGVAAKVSTGGKIDTDALEREQHAAQQQALDSWIGQLAQAEQQGPDHGPPHRGIDRPGKAAVSATGLAAADPAGGPAGACVRMWTSALNALSISIGAFKAPSARTGTCAANRSTGTGW